jgi:uncharacterized protein with NAD-binding domain and iron-sulfur cluster
LPLPRYVQRSSGFDVALAGPYAQREVSARIYVLAADKHTLKATCDRYLNLGGEWRYEPLGGFVLLALMHMNRVYAGDRSLGWMREIDVAFQVPLLKYEPGAVVPSGVALSSPYLWVNSCWPLITGRECLGFRKEIGVSFSENDDRIACAADLTRVNAFVVPARGEMLAPRPIVELLEQPADGCAPLDPLDAAGELGLALGNLSLRTSSALLAYFEMGVPFVLLRQLRDARSPELACIQEILEAPVRIPKNGLRNAAMLRRLPRVRIHEYASHPIPAELGLGAGPTVELAPLWGFEADVDFDVELPSPPRATPRPAAAGSPPARKPRKIAILGGGPAALATAVDLVRSGEPLEIVIYTAGWRLGGKCASGRNFDEASRTEEHGLHLPMGFYENFFDQIRWIYESLGRPGDHPLATWQQAFVPRDTFVLRERLGSSGEDWAIVFPRNRDIPGDRARRSVAGRPESAFSLRRMLRSILAWLIRGVRSLGILRDSAGRLLRLGLRPRHGGEAEAGADAPLDRHLTALIDGVGDLLGRSVWPRIRARLDSDASLRRSWIVLELAAACARGLLYGLRTGVSLDDLDELDFLEWLDAHAPLGRLSDVTRGSAPARMIYEIIFAYRDGDHRTPSLAAGVALRGLFRLLFGYSGAVAFEMPVSLAETTIAAYYEFLAKQPGIRFEFFSRVRKLEPSADGTRIEAVTMGIQATPIEGTYDPLLRVAGLDVWPNRPRYDRLVECAALAEGRELEAGGYDLESSHTAWKDVGTRTLRVGEDFDAVVLAIPSPALADITDALCQREPRWRAMVDHVTGVATLGVQVWSTATATDLVGARGCAGRDRIVLGGSSDVLGTVGDISQFTRYESWGNGHGPQSCLSSCGAFPFRVDGLPPDQPCPEALARASTRARELADAWMVGDAIRLFPGLACLPEGEGARGEAEGGRAIAGRHVSANASPTARFITSYPGTTKFRLRPDEGLFGNLYLAGDWTRTGLNAGCLESAVTSGRLAARAVVGRTYPIYGAHD